MKTLPPLQALFAFEASRPSVAFVCEPRLCKLALFNMPL
jgi:hypothetical protein